MKLGPAIEEFIQYKQALGSSYTGPARILRSFLRKTGDLELAALTTQDSDVFLPSLGWGSYEQLVPSLLGTPFFLRLCQ